jgi:hypothetical protein
VIEVAGKANKSFSKLILSIIKNIEKAWVAELKLLFYIFIVKIQKTIINEIPILIDT